MKLFMKSNYVIDGGGTSTKLYRAVNDELILVGSSGPGNVSTSLQQTCENIDDVLLKQKVDYKDCTFFLAGYISLPEEGKGKMAKKYPGINIYSDVFLPHVFSGKSVSFTIGTGTSVVSYDRNQYKLFWAEGFKGYEPCSSVEIIRSLLSDEEISPLVIKYLHVEDEKNLYPLKPEQVLSFSKMLPLLFENQKLKEWIINEFESQLEDLFTDKIIQMVDESYEIIFNGGILNVKEFREILAQKIKGINDFVSILDFNKARI